MKWAARKLCAALVFRVSIFLKFERMRNFTVSTCKFSYY